jgi:3-hydroxyacyl-CoA dehydrogenase
MELDTLVHVAMEFTKTVQQTNNTSCLNFKFVNKMMENKWLGSKTNQGFYKEGKRYSDFDLDTLEYRAAKSFCFRVN